MNDVSPVFTEYELQIIRELAVHRVELGKDAKDDGLRLPIAADVIDQTVARRDGLAEHDYR